MAALNGDLMRAFIQIVAVWFILIVPSVRSKPLPYEVHSKLTKAQELGVTVISEDELMRMIGEE